jgi:hypothetical protein
MNQDRRLAAAGRTSRVEPRSPHIEVEASERDRPVFVDFAAPEGDEVTVIGGITEPLQKACSRSSSWFRKARLAPKPRRARRQTP